MAAKADGHPWVVAALGRMAERGQTLSFAESCTGGVLSAMVTRVSGASRVYMGAMITYSNASKEKLLGVPATLLQVHGAVSVPVVRRMAEGAREKFNSTWSVAITGIAGPGGGSPDKPVGTVCFAILGPGVDRVTRRRFKGPRREIQRRSAGFALKMLMYELGFSSGERLKVLKKAKSGKRR